MVLDREKQVPPSPTPALNALGVSVRRGQREVVSNVDLTVHAHSVVALIGPNGSGKTTLLKALAGLIPCRGAIEIQGRSSACMDQRERARLVAYVPQHSALDAPMPVKDVVAQGRLAHVSAFSGPSRKDLDAIDDAMATADVARFANHPFTALSHGERHRVLIARGLAAQTPLLLMDEPTAGLDIEHVLSILNLLRVLAKSGKAVLVVLHPLAEVKEAAGVVSVLSNGRVVASGSTDCTLTPPVVREVYNVSPVEGAAWGFVRLSDADR